MRPVLGVLVALCLSSSCNRFHSARSLDLPAIVLWAWERPEDLGFLAKQSRNSGVAFLAGTAVIAANGSVFFRMRTQNLTLPMGVAVLAVVRIESPAVHARVEMPTLLSGLQTVVRLPGMRGLQIDFDARRSERAFYRTLIESLRAQTDKPVGITALVSWCDGDRWIDDQPVDEAVPMFFRMGRGETRQTRLRSALCRSSIGLATDEAWPAKRPAGLQRIYLFSPNPWTEPEYTRAMRRIEEWK